MDTFPTLRLGVLQGLLVLRHEINTNPGFLRHKDCPYDSDTVVALEKIFEERIVEKIVEREIIKDASSSRGRPSEKSVKLTEADQALIENSALELLIQLQSLGLNDKGDDIALDTHTKIQIVKAKAALIEQIVKLRERFYNVKRVSEFQSTVMSMLDDLVSEADRSEFLKRLEPFRD